MKGIGGSRIALRATTSIVVVLLIGVSCTAKSSPRASNPPSPTLTTTQSTSPSPSATTSATCDAPDSGWDAIFTPSSITARLVGQWQLCSPKSIFGTSDEGIEFTADRHWYKLGVDASGSVVRLQGTNNEGTWSLHDPSSLNKSQDVLLGLSSKIGGLQASPQFAIKTTKMRLGDQLENNGFHTRAEYAKFRTGVTSPVWPDLMANGFTRRVGIQGGFTIDIPKEWKGGWFEGVWDFEPKGLPSTSEGGNTFAVTATLEHGSYTSAFPGAQTTRTTIEGRSALTTSPDTTHVAYAIDWHTGYPLWSSAAYAGGRNLDLCPDYAETCTGGPSDRRLIIRLFGSTDSLWSQYQAIGQLAAHTVRPYEGSEPAHGTVKGTTKMNVYARALARFMDARVEGVGAEDMMCCSAPKNYSSAGGLYESNGSAVVSYDATRDARPVAEPASQGFDVTIHFANGKTRTEFISVGFESGKTSPFVPPKTEGTCLNC